MPCLENVLHNFPSVLSQERRKARKKEKLGNSSLTNSKERDQKVQHSVS